MTRSDIPILEPAPFRNRPLDDAFFTQQTDYGEYQSTWGRSCGLLPRAAGERGELVDENPPGVLRLASIRAIGERGYPIVIQANDVEFEIPPFDTERLSHGRHRLFACLESHRTPCGPHEEYDDPCGGPALKAPVHRRARVVLATDDHRFEFRDWIQVAAIVRERSGGHLQTRLDAFHPPIQDMRAWTRTRNPLVRLVDRVTPLLEDAIEKPLVQALRVELQVLRSLSAAAPAATAFTQAQRCLGLVRAAHLSFVPDGGLESFRFHPDEFAAFLVALDDSLGRAPQDSLYPDHLEAGGRKYFRAEGEFTRQQDLWVWSPPPEIEQVNSLALYFPHAVQNDLPVMRYGRARDEATAYRTATFAKDLRGPGCLVALDEIRGKLERVHLTSATSAVELRLERGLLDGHALYYF